MQAIFERDNLISKEIETYNSKIKNMFVQESVIPVKNYLYSDSMTGFELVEQLNKLNTNNIANQILKYEFENINFEFSHTAVDLFLEKTNEILLRYQYRAGGFMLEDPEWSFYDDTTKKYPLKSNEYLFENSVCESNYHDPSLTWYLENLVRILNTLSEDVRVSYKKIHIHDDAIIWIVIKCVVKQ